MSGIGLVAAYDMSNINPPDLGPRGNRYPGTGNNIVAADILDGISGGKCLRFDGDDSYVDIGNVVELNAVSAFTIAFWMNQDVLDQTDVIFRNRVDDNSEVRIVTLAIGGLLNVYVANGGAAFGSFDYSTVISAGTWYYVAAVYDGGGAANVDRLVVYVDGVPVTLAFTGTIPATTADMSAVSATIGYSAVSFDGKLDECRIYDAPLTMLQVNDLMVAQRQGRG